MRTSVEKSVKTSMGTRKFRLDCFPFIFTLDELEVLEQKGHIMKALYEGKVRPESKEEKEFVRVCKGQSMALSYMETAWLKYQHRRELEASLLQNEEVYRDYLRLRKQ